MNGPSMVARWVARFGMAVLALICVAPSHGQSAPPPSAITVTLIGDADEALSAQLRGASTLAGDGDRELVTLAAVRRIAEEDAERLTQVLHAQGRYAGRVEADARRDLDGFSVVFRVRAGPPFTIAGHEIRYADPTPDAERARPTTPQALGVSVSDSARGVDLTVVERGVLTTLRQSGYPNARRVERFVEADFTAQTAIAVLVLETGPRARFGPVRWSGLERVRADYLERMIPWTPGAPFSAPELRTYRDRLGRTGLFSVIQLDPGAPDAEGLAPVLADLRERPARSVGGGVSFSTNLGPGATAFWEHRNLLGRAEQLRFSGAAAANERALEARGRKPFPRARLAAFAGVEVAREENDAFDANRFTTNAGVEKRWAQRWSARIAGELEVADASDAFGERRSTLFAAPLRLAWDSVDDALNPTRGSRIAADLTPVTGDSDGALSFLGAEATLVRHQPLTDGGGVVLAGWSRIGGVMGADIDDIPATRRLYAGGGGSVRAYGFQQLGPLADDGQPTGGRSVVEGGLEARLRVAGAWSLAGFVEGGVVSAQDSPDFSFDDALTGAGLGVRYATPVGPVRLDVATPFDRRDGVDDPVQVYISLGQAF